MGVSMMLGLANLVGEVFNGIFTTLINWVVVPVIRLCIKVVITLIKYLTSVIWLELSKLLLSLIDFVETLFRALAGLKASGTGISISMTLGGRTGDLLISMLTSSEVVTAFYSTAIVGIFLLIITTIFQMIKVEYTTEGANNSKTGIIGKSLKSLSNMIIIPLLCILGVFIGNQVLDLIDTATGGGAGTTISAQLWVTAGSEALVEGNSLFEHKTGKGKDYFKGVTNTAGLIGPAISLAFDTIFSKTFEVSNNLNSDPTAGDEYTTVVGIPITDNGARKTAEERYLSGELKIYDTQQMLTHYNPFEVNYLVLIFGAVIILKCLFYTCFGMIDRLYQCVALFIVMPMVIGMSPVKDSLGSWRSKFMSKALSAYGTVISLNLFFIIVRVMLNIDITVGYEEGKYAVGTILSVFSSSFWEGLIKSLMVIVGCMMIEKLAGDLGQYFGGGNAMAEGKGLAKDATAGLTKAATAAGGVAMGVGKMAIKGAGIAGKVGGSALKMANKATGGALGDAAHAVGNWSGNLTKKAGHAIGGWKPVQKTVAFGRGVGSAAKKAKNWVTEANAGVYHSNKKLMKAEEQLAKDEKAYATAKAYSDRDAKRNPRGKDKQREIAQRAENTKNAEARMNASREKVEKLHKEAEKLDAYNKQKETNKALRKAKFVKTKEGVGQLFENKFGAGAMFSQFAPKGLQNLKKDYDTAVKTAMDASPEGQALMAMLDKSEKDKAEAAFDKRNAGAIESRHLAQTQLVLTTSNAVLNTTSKETNRELEKMNETLLDLIAKMNAAKGRGDETNAGLYASRIANLQDAMVAKNGKIKFGDDLKVVSEEMLKVDFKMDDNFMKKIQDEIKKGVKMDDIMEQISEEFKKMGVTDKDTLAKIYKALEDLKANFGGK